MSNGERLSVSFEAGARRNEAPDVQIFDPPMCCPTGLCGPTLDPVLLDVNEMVLKLRAQGVRVERYALNAQPQAFMAHAEVFRLVREAGLPALPITVVKGQIAKTGRYPTFEEVQAALNGH